MSSLNFELFKCSICGKQSPYADDLDECSGCKKTICIECSELIEGVTLCSKCVSSGNFDYNDLHEKKYG